MRFVLESCGNRTTFSLVIRKHLLDSVFMLDGKRASSATSAPLCPTPQAPLALHLLSQLLSSGQNNYPRNFLVRSKIVSALNLFRHADAGSNGS
jgi:hypothetical protein